MTLKRAGFRCETDRRAEKIGYKIRSAQQEKIPYMLIIGEKEIKTNRVSVRKRDDGDLGVMTMEQFLNLLQKEVN